MLSLIPDVIKLPVAIALGAVLAFYPARWLGQSEGKQMAATAALTKSVQVLRERNTIDDEVSTSDAAALCADLGLPDDQQAECVRRVLSPDAEPADVGSDSEDGSAVRKPDCQPQ
ncbi:hypothetical protein HFO28_07815 [Rhizobium leguminosarum]|uniref:hypothetical protein n=1 Tax=Rhizobium TaxID=379 RepID=UPI001C90B81B|nr:MULTISPECIES: hypothetical protein [Rhizobium]MBY3295746.1 hypothetical protein [Rhizobium laguerreae]MBY5743498.1 hypothetical protein [Rhizobium leguminosarum]